MAKDKFAVEHLATFAQGSDWRFLNEPKRELKA